MYAANLLSLFRIVITPFFVFFLFQNAIPWAFLVCLVAGITDVFDGYLARRYNLTSSWGNFLDPFADKIFVFSAFFSFYFLNVVPIWFILVLLFRDFLVTGLRLILIKKGVSFSTSLIAKIKTSMQGVLIFTILVHLFTKNGDFGIIHTSIIPFLIYLVAGLTIYSAINYVNKYLNETYC